MYSEFINYFERNEYFESSYEVSLNVEAAAFGK
jgi:hypothetical protein